MSLKYTCPGCGPPWAVMDGMEGTLYVESCPDCHLVSMKHQQT